MAKKKGPGGSEATNKANELLDAVNQEFLSILGNCRSSGEGDHLLLKKKLEIARTGKTILAQDQETQIAIVGVASERMKNLEAKRLAFWSKIKPGVLAPKQVTDGNKVNDPVLILTLTLRALLRRDLLLSEAVILRLLQWLANGKGSLSDWHYPLSGLANAVEYFARSNEIGAPLRQVLEKVVKKLYKSPYEEHCRKIADRLQAVLAGGKGINLEPGEVWSDAVLHDLQMMNAKASQAWKDLLNHCQAGGRGKISDQWQEKAKELVASVGFDALKEHILSWFPLVDKPRTRPYVRRHNLQPEYENLILPAHVEMLRGLVWCCGLIEDTELAGVITRLAFSAYRKLPGKGPRLVSLGNACITALGLMPGRPAVSQLALLKVKVKFGAAQKEIEKAFNASAAREGLPCVEIEELAVPSYGLAEVGHLRETFGEYEAELLVDGSAVTLHWHKDGKPLKTVPAEVKKNHAEEFKVLQATVKEMSAMLPAQRERIDTLFLAQKTWPLAVWKERYLNHPLVGAIGRRLIWSFSTKGKEVAGIWADGLAGAAGKPLTLKDDATVSLWHPIGHSTDEVRAWRDFLERREIVQPFKQAHREVYLLTDAERRIGAYSNRFAAHILRQHQFHALCAARGWKDKLRLMVDDTYPPAHRLLPQWGVRGEYWIEGAGSDYGRDTTGSGAFLYLSTDQVRFYPIAAPQLHAHASGGGYGAVRQAPTSRCCWTGCRRSCSRRSCATSICSSGWRVWATTPTGPTVVRAADTATTGSATPLASCRRQRIRARRCCERLLPRLKIAESCSLRDRFLVVRGSVRTYKIHLGSGNILMEPGDQYLCIVPKQTVAAGERVFLPFEGDGTLSIILSKAFLLADDAKIKDKSITNQLKK